MSNDVLISFIEMLVNRLSNVERDVKAMRDDRIEDALKKGEASKTLLGTPFQIKVHHKAYATTAYTDTDTCILLNFALEQFPIEFVQNNMDECIGIIRELFPDETQQERLVTYLRNIDTYNEDGDCIEQSSMLRDLGVDDSRKCINSILLTKLLARRCPNIVACNINGDACQVIYKNASNEMVRLDHAVSDVWDAYSTALRTPQSVMYNDTIEVLPFARDHLKVVKALVEYASNLDSPVTPEDRRQVADIIKPKRGLWMWVEKVFSDATHWFFMTGWADVFVREEWLRKHE